MTALITATVIGAGTSLYLGNQAKQDAKGARGEILDAEERSLAQQDDQYQQTREDWEPWREAGTNALAQLDDPEANFQKSPGYKFRLDEGTRNTENAFSVKGGGGNAMRALAEYSQDFASNDYGNWYNRQLGKAGLGTTGTAYTTGAGTNKANTNSNSIWRSGEDRASIGLYGANQQASYTADALGTLLGGVKNYAGNRAPDTSGGGNWDNSYMFGNQTDEEMLNNFKWGG